MEWISVEDRMPSVNQKCLIYCYDPLFGYWTILQDKYFGDGKWLVNDTIKDKIISHWMPLSPPPEVVE